MAKVTITVTDNGDGTVKFDTEPKMAALLDRKRQHGIAALTSGETYAIIALSKMLELANSDVDKERGSKIILPPGIVS